MTLTGDIQQLVMGGSASAESKEKDPQEIELQVQVQQNGDGNNTPAEGNDTSAGNDATVPFIVQSMPQIEQEKTNGCCGKPRCSCLNRPGFKGRYAIYNPRHIAKQDLTSRNIGEDFRSRASLVGLTQIHEADHLIKKGFWIILTITALVLLVVHTYSLINSYAQQDVNVELELSAQKIMEFPAVTICNNNMIVVPYANDPAVGNQNRDQDKYYDYLQKNDSSLGHQAEDLFVKKTFNNAPLEQGDLKRILNPHYGNCYTFNMDAGLKTRRALPGYGLNLELNIESYKYNNLSDHDPPSFRGAIIKVHEPGTEAIMAEGGIIVGANTINRLAIKKTRYTRLDTHSPCVQEGDNDLVFSKRNYTKEHCDNTCLQKEIVKECKCYLKTITRDLEILRELNPDARFDITQCTDDNQCWKDVWAEYDNGNLTCSQCKQLCSETVYDISTVSAPWPTYDYIDGIMLDRLEENKRLKTQLTNYKLFPNATFTRDLIKNNFLRVEIYFDSMTVTDIKEVPAIRFSEFASEMSSAIGFWIGWSVWTIGQFFELLSDLLVLAVRKCRRRGSGSSASGEVERGEEDDNEDSDIGLEAVVTE